MSLRLASYFALFGLLFSHALAALADDTDATAGTQQVQIRLLSSHRAVQPGQTLIVGITQEIAPHWHTYWRNPGDSGAPTEVKWTLPEKWQAGELQWPLPQRIDIADIANHGYEGRATLLASIQVPSSQPQGPARIEAQVNWLVCKDVCIPQKAILRLPIEVAPQAQANPQGQVLIDAARQALPQAVNGLLARRGEHAVWVQLPTAAPASAQAQFFANAWGVTQHNARQTLQRQDGQTWLHVPLGDAPPPSGGRLEGLLRIGDKGYGVSAPLEAAPPQWEQTAAQANKPAWSAQSTPLASREHEARDLGLWAALGLAFLGGLVLNLMPCVFPVLSIKALSLLRHPDQAWASRVRHAAAYTSGVASSFVGLALGLLALQASGQEVGWGFQFQSPWFVLLMAVLLFGVGLNLASVFSFGHGVTGLGQGLAQRDGLAGSFFTGVLATVVATPCTAPFMATAVGYALTQPPLVVVSVFLSLGLGLAAPYVLLSLWPALQRRLPRPGAWMERFKQALAFPMFAASIWLVWVLAQQAGPQAVAIALGAMLLLGLAAWIHGSSQVSTELWRRRGAWLSGLVFVGGSALTVLAWQGLPVDGGEAAAPPQAGAASGQAFEPYTPQRLGALRAEGKPVFVNLTAAWCITCLMNERVALRQDSVRQAFREHGVTYLKGDWTRQDPAITRVLREFDRSGVPLYLVYPADARQAPFVLPQVLTPDIVRDAIAKAAKGAAGAELATTAGPP